MDEKVEDEGRFARECGRFENALKGQRRRLVCSTYEQNLMSVSSQVTKSRVLTLLQFDDLVIDKHKFVEHLRVDLVFPTRLL